MTAANLTFKTLVDSFTGSFNYIEMRARRPRLRFHQSSNFRIGQRDGIHWRNRATSYGVGEDATSGPAYMEWGSFFGVVPVDASLSVEDNDGVLTGSDEYRWRTGASARRIGRPAPPGPAAIGRVP